MSNYKFGIVVNSQLISVRETMMGTRLGDKVRELRKERKLTLEKLADLAGLSKKLSVGTGKS